MAPLPSRLLRSAAICLTAMMLLLPLPLKVPCNLLSGYLHRVAARFHTGYEILRWMDCSLVEYILILCEKLSAVTTRSNDALCALLQIIEPAQNLLFICIRDWLLTWPCVYRYTCNMWYENILRITTAYLSHMYFTYALLSVIKALFHHVSHYFKYPFTYLVISPHISAVGGNDNYHSSEHCLLIASDVMTFHNFTQVTKLSIQLLVHYF